MSLCPPLWSRLYLINYLVNCFNLNILTFSFKVIIRSTILKFTPSWIYCQPSRPPEFWSWWALIFPWLLMKTKKYIIIFRYLPSYHYYFKRQHIYKEKAQITHKVVHHSGSKHQHRQLKMLQLFNKYSIWERRGLDWFTNDSWRGGYVALSWMNWRRERCITQINL